jgi:hypothetical protein
VVVKKRRNKMTNKCCWLNQQDLSVGCDKDAIWEIRDRDNPNPYENDTYSCDEHLATMLTARNTVDYLGKQVNEWTKEAE